jgi:hypothetical protein
LDRTWTGYKAVLTDGVYSFEESVTEGLTYGGAGFTPEIGAVYNDGCTVIVRKFYTGPAAAVYIIPFRAASDVCQTGQPLTQRGTPQYETVDGVQCVYIEDASFSVPDGQIGVDNFSIYFRYRLFDGGANDTGLFWFGSGGNDFGFWLDGTDVKVGTAGNSGKRIDLDFSAEYNVWYNVLVTLENDILKVYVDNTLVLSDTFPINIVKNGSFYIGAYGSEGQYLSSLPIHISDFRIYDEVVTPADL